MVSVRPLYDKKKLNTHVLSDDPWIDATVSSRSIDFQSTSLTPVFLGKGSHTADIGNENAEVEPTIAYIQEQAIAYIQSWLADWTPRFR